MLQWVEGWEKCRSGKMLLDKSQVEERLNSEDNLANRFVRVEERLIHRPGKSGNEPSLSKDQVNEIAIRARTGERPVDIAGNYSIGVCRVNQIKNGHSAKIDEDKVEKAVEQVRDKALDRLMVSLGLITNDKLEKCSAKELSFIAANMGRVVEKSVSRVSEANTQVIIYAPEVRQESRYKVVEI